MRKELLFSLCLLAVSVFASAKAPEAVNVVRKNASISSTLLTNVQNITFDAAMKTMTILEKDAAEQTFDLLDVRSVLFGAYILSEDVSIEIDPTPAEDDGVRKVLINGQVVIIRDNVKYNVLGMRIE